MKTHLFTTLMLAGLVGVAQTPRLSLYEEFTGETCPPCASTNPGLNALLLSATNATKIVAIKWQVPIPTAPSTPWSLYQTNKSEIDWRYRSTTAGGYGYISQNTASSATVSGINSAPSGKIDGQHQWVFGAASNHPANMNNNVISTAQSVMSPFSVTMQRAWDANYSAVNVTVNITASMNFTATGNLVFRTVMVERIIQFSVQPGTNGETKFEDVGIKSFPTLQAGTPMVSAWINGQSQTFTLNCPIPSYVRDKSEIAMVGFIQDDGDRKVHQAVRADKESLPNDAKAMTAVVPGFICTNSIAPVITVRNHGANALTAFTVTPYIDAAPQAPYYWTGNLAIGASTTIALPAITGITQGNHTFMFNVTDVAGGDVNLSNNFATAKFKTVLTYGAGPVTEGFVSATFPPANWSTNSTASSTWIRVTTTGFAPTLGNAAKLDLWTLPDGSVHELFLPPLNFSIAPTLEFDVAYAQYASGNLDKLEVLVSTDCGQSWSSVYNKAGSQLTTVGVYSSGAWTPGSNNPSHWRHESVPLTATGDMLVMFRGTSDYGNNMYLDNINLKACTTQTLEITSNKTKICKGETATLTVTGANTYSWSNNQTSPTIVVSPTSNVTYVATSADADGCGNSTAFTLTVSACTGLADNAGTVHQVYPNPSSGEFTITGDFGGSNAVLVIYSITGQKLHEQALNAEVNAVKCELAKGIYQYQVIQGDYPPATGKLIIK